MKIILKRKITSYSAILLPFNTSGAIDPAGRLYLACWPRLEGA